MGSHEYRAIRVYEYRVLRKYGGFSTVKRMSSEELERMLADLNGYGWRPIFIVGDKIIFEREKPSGMPAPE